MNLIDRLHLENKARALTDEESAALARAVKSEKIAAYQRKLYASKKAALQSRARQRYATDPEYRVRRLATNRASYHRTRAISAVGLSRQIPENENNGQSI